MIQTQAERSASALSRNSLSAASPRAAVFMCPPCASEHTLVLSSASERTTCKPLPLAPPRQRRAVGHSGVGGSVSNKATSADAPPWSSVKFQEDADAWAGFACGRGRPKRENVCVRTERTEGGKEGRKKGAQEKKEAGRVSKKSAWPGKRSTRQKTASVILCVMAALGGSMSHDISVVRGAQGYLDTSLQTSDLSEAQEEEKK